MRSKIIPKSKDKDKKVYEDKNIIQVGKLPNLEKQISEGDLKTIDYLVNKKDINNSNCLPENKLSTISKQLSLENKLNQKLSQRMIQKQKSASVSNKKPNDTNKKDSSKHEIVEFTQEYLEETRKKAEEYIKKTIDLQKKSVTSSKQSSYTDQNSATNSGNSTSISLVQNKIPSSAVLNPNSLEQKQISLSSVKPEKYKDSVPNTSYYNPTNQINSQTSANFYNQNYNDAYGYGLYANNSNNYHQYNTYFNNNYSSMVNKSSQNLNTNQQKNEVNLSAKSNSIQKDNSEKSSNKNLSTDNIKNIPIPPSIKSEKNNDWDKLFEDDTEDLTIDITQTPPPPGVDDDNSLKHSLVKPNNESIVNEIINFASTAEKEVNENESYAKDIQKITVDSESSEKDSSLDKKDNESLVSDILMLAESEKPEFTAVEEDEEDKPKKDNFEMFLEEEEDLNFEMIDF